MSKKFTGRVHSFILEDPPFYIMRVQLDGSDDHARPLTCKGKVVGLSLTTGSWFGFEGRWVEHAQYGRQIEITKAPVVDSEWDAEKALKVLSSHGVGSFTCKAIQGHFDDDAALLSGLESVEKLEGIPGIDKFSAVHVCSRWKAVKTMFRTLSFLGDMNLPTSRIEAIWSAFGDETEDILAQDPWRIVQIDGLTFAHADQVAERLGLDMRCEARLRGALLFATKSQRGMGHLFQSAGELYESLSAQVPDLTPEQVANLLRECHGDKSLVVDNGTRKGTTAVYEPWFYDLELKSAEMMSSRQASARFEGEDKSKYIEALGRVGDETKKVSEESKDIKIVAHKALAEWSSQSHIQLSEAQMQGALNALTEPVSILTGLPGTGKTTTLRTVVKVLQDAEVPFLLVAPTGIAAKRVQTVSGAEASTIHRAFGAQGMDMDDERESTYSGIVGEKSSVGKADGSGEMWGFNEGSPHPARVIIVDESSMVDQHIIFRILQCTSPQCRIVLVGDAAQLPSVGPGNVLRDLDTCELFPTVKLTEIYRQAEASDIVKAAHAINAGELPKDGDDFRLFELRSDSSVADAVVDTAVKLYRRGANFQVLSPRHGGDVGVTALNSRLRTVLNPKSPGVAEMKLGNEYIREGDRVMVVKNNYTFEVFNGDVGKVVSINRRNKEIEIKIWGPPTTHVILPLREASNMLRLAYCMTVHKSQGQEYDFILLPWVLGFRRQLQRNLVYTAITRAKKKVLLFGHSQALFRGIQNNRVDARNTLFPERLLQSSSQMCFDGELSGPVPSNVEDME